MARGIFDNAAATIASRKIAAAVDACGVVEENCFHAADGFDDLWVLQFGQLAQTANGAGDQHQIVGFFGLLAPDDINPALAGFLLDPGLDGGKRGFFLSVQPAFAQGWSGVIGISR